MALRLNHPKKRLYDIEIARANVAPTYIIATPTLSGIKVGLGAPELGL